MPIETSYYFETGIRRSIKIVPHFTNKNKNPFNKEGELYTLEVICLYNNLGELKAEKFKIHASEIEGIYYSEKHVHKDFITALVNDWFDKRTKEQFETDFNLVFAAMKEI